MTGMEFLADGDRHLRHRRHPASLNFADCLSYAVAQRSGMALLFKGEDFARTDLSDAMASAR